MDTVMPSIINKQKIVNQILSVSGSKKADHPETRSVLEQFIYAVCREGVTREQAEEAFHQLETCFFDWNEVRVSSTHELAEAMDNLPGAEQRAQRIIDFLQEVFETTFSFEMEGMQKKGLKQAAKQLSRYKAADDYAVAWVVQQSLGGHAIPLDQCSIRVLYRLGLVSDETAKPESLRSSLEHQIPKAKGAQFVDAVSIVAETVCWDHDPNCTACPLINACPTGKEMKNGAVMVAGSRKPK